LNMFNNLTFRKHEIRTIISSEIWLFEQMTFWKFDFCSKFGNMTFEILAFRNLEFGKKRSTVKQDLKSRPG
jgi:hypothetical protein